MIRVFANQDRVRRPLLPGKCGTFRPGATRTNGISMSFAKTIALATLVALPAVAEAKPPLRDVKEIDNELYYIAIANEISEYCPVDQRAAVESDQRDVETAVQSEQTGVLGYGNPLIHWVGCGKKPDAHQGRGLSGRAWREL